MTRTPEYHEKGWGHELWIHNDHKYCGKLLFFKADHGCSYHYHRLKHETFFLQSGEIQVAFGYADDIAQSETITLKPGDSFEVPPGLRHRMYALEDSELFEFSTEHFEEDSYRIFKGD
jgi:mannose-6-phosphate isomerase-like protein (cupin superfamily)